MLFDAHTHLNYEGYTDDERAELAWEIEESEVDYIIDAADCVTSAEQAIADAEAYPWCYAAVGIHPDRAERYSEEARTKSGNEDETGMMSAISELIDSDIAKIKELATHPKAVAIGEIGLDFHYGADYADVQQELFRKQIRLANDLHMPIMIHSRDAAQLTMDILIEEGAFSDERKSWFPSIPLLGADGDSEAEFVSNAGVQLHCYSGSVEMAEEYVRLGATISLGGPVTFKNGKKAAEVALRIPIGMLLSETDAPYLAPEPLRGRPNRSPYIAYTVRRLAMLKGLSYEDAAAILTANGKRFFNIE